MLINGKDSKRYNNPFIMKNLDELICYSISKVDHIEKRNKLANKILLCGGGA